MSAELACLHCGQTKAEIKRNETFCGIVSGYEYRELEAEWPRHRWADWRDTELDRMGILPEAYDRHRRESVMTTQYVACADTKRGHVYPRKEDAEFGIPEDQCWACGHHKLEGSES